MLFSQTVFRMQQFKKMACVPISKQLFRCLQEDIVKRTSKIISIFPLVQLKTDLKININWHLKTVFLMRCSKEGVLLDFIGCKHASALQLRSHL